jgi:hypothetical protein
MNNGQMYYHFFFFHHWFILVREVSSGIKWFQAPSIAVAGDRTVVIPTKFSVNHQWTN